MRLRKVFFTGLAGGLAGLGGFGLGAYFGYYFSSAYAVVAVEGAALGLCCGAYISAFDWLTLHRAGRALQALLIGAVIGGCGGGLGLVVSEIFFGAVGGGLIGRCAAWALAGALIGVSYGLASFSFSRLKRGAVGGALGGIVGGLLLFLVTDLLRFAGVWGKFVGFLLLGGAIGYAVGLVEEIMKKSWLVQLTGKGEGSEYALDRAEVKVGRSSSADIRLGDDRQVALRHADLRRDSDGSYTLYRGEDAPEVLVNKQSVGEKILFDGDVIQLGATRLMFREKQTRSRISGSSGAVVSLLFLVLTTCFLLMGPYCLAGASAQSSYEVNVSQVDMSSFPDLSVLVTVTDGSGNPARNLKHENFILMEDSREVDTFTVVPVSESGRAACDVVFVFDTTGSMSNEIEGVKRICLRFANELAASNIDVRLGLVTFGDEIREVFEPVAQPEQFRMWVSGLSANGGGDNPENALKALETAAGMQLRESAQKVLVLITDAPPHEAANSRGRTLTTHSVDDAFIALLNQAGATVYSIADDVRQYHTISERTGGMFFEIMKDEERFAKLVDTLGTILANQYNFRFKSRRPRLDGTWRGVSVRIVRQDRLVGSGETDYMTGGLTGGKLETGFRLPFLAMFALSLVLYFILPALIGNIMPAWAAGSRREACLIAISGRSEGNEYSMGGGTLLVGEGNNVNIRVAGGGLACLEKRPGNVSVMKVEHEPTPGAILLNGNPIDRESVLKDGDVVKVGAQKFLFKTGSATKTADLPQGGRGDSASPAACFRLVPVDDVPGLKPVDLSGNRLTVGRSRDCDICIEHTSVSRQHAELIKKTQGYAVRDTDSKNGTFVNGRRISENLLKDGFTVRFGEVTLDVKGSGVTPVAPKEPPAAKPVAAGTCSSCGADFRPGGKFCPGCGKQI